MTAVLQPQPSCTEARRDAASSLSLEGPKNSATEPAGRSPWQLLSAAAAVVVLVRSLVPIRDIDLYWHLLAGQQIATGHSVNGIGASWSFAPVRGSWTTTQWLSELMLRGIYDAGGWMGVIVWRTSMAALVAGMLARLLLRRRPGPWAHVLFAATLFLASLDFQERPELFSIPLLIWLSGVMHRWLQQGTAPNPIRFAALTWLWANLHGYFIMAPACAALAATVVTGERMSRRQHPVGREVPRLARLWLVPVLATSAGMLTPVGPRLLLTPLTFHAATRHIAEWQPTTLTSPAVAVFALVVGAAVAGWLRSRKANWLAIGYCATWSGFAALALRNVPVTALLIAPFVVDALRSGFPVRRRHVGAGEARMLRAATAVALSAGVALTALGMPSIQPIPDGVPVTLAHRLAELPGTQRVLNDYNTAGALLFFGGPTVQVAIDGRADRYTGYVDSYLDLIALHGRSWPQLLAQLHPTAAVVDIDSALAYELQSHRGWRADSQSGKYVLLLPPASPIAS